MPGPADEVVAKNALWYPFDPLITLAALSQSTTHIGLVATVSSTYLPPYHLARKYAALDQVSQGRSFGLDQQLAHAHRYARAHEHVKFVKGAVGRLGGRCLHPRQGGQALLRPGPAASRGTPG